MTKLYCAFLPANNYIDESPLMLISAAPDYLEDYMSEDVTVTDLVDDYWNIDPDFDELAECTYMYNPELKTQDEIIAEFKNMGIEMIVSEWLIENEEDY